ncbi:MAG: hypothetical protein NZ949_03295 [Candidatus Kapabacteria bacterium]|nr:hypothetical protein [Candidatus Kapabacteria bacterium]
MGWRLLVIVLLSGVVLWLPGCSTVRWPAFYHLERPFLLSPDHDRDAWAVGANLSAGESLNSEAQRFTGVSAGAGYRLSSRHRILALRAMAMAYGGGIGEEAYGGIGIVQEPSLNLPLTRWISLNVVSEIGVAYEFGPYARYFSNRLFPSLGLGGGITLHFSPQSHLAADCRLLVPFSVRLAYLTDTWGVHVSTLRWGSAWSIGTSYLLGQETLTR